MCGTFTVSAQRQSSLSVFATHVNRQLISRLSTARCQHRTSLKAIATLLCDAIHQHVTAATKAPAGIELDVFDQTLPRRWTKHTLPWTSVFGYKHAEGRGRLPEPGVAVLFVCGAVAMATAAGPAPVSRERLWTNGPVFHTHPVCNAGYDSKPRFWLCLVLFVYFNHRYYCIFGGYCGYSDIFLLGLWEAAQAGAKNYILCAECWIA